jgi:TPR repeat protein
MATRYILICLSLVSWNLAIAQSGRDSGKAWFPIQPNPAPRAVMPQAEVPPSTLLFQQSIEELERRASESTQMFQALENRIPLIPNRDASALKNQATDLGTSPRKEDGFRYFLAGRYFWRGENGYPRDISIAIVLLRRAVQAEYPPAIYQLGKLYLTGSGVPMNEQVGVELMRRARRLGASDNELDLMKNGLLY